MEFSETDYQPLRAEVEAGPMIRFHDTPSRGKGSCEPFEPGRVRMYSCGQTVWNYSHIGNFGCFLFYDVLKRYVTYRGFEVEHVMNLTDIDDRIVQKVAESGGLEEYVGPYIDAFFMELDALGIQRADYYPRATEHIPEMVQLVDRLTRRGMAYVREGSVYFSIGCFPGYGDFAHLGKRGLRRGARIDSDRCDKEDVRTSSSGRPGPRWTALWPGIRHGAGAAPAGTSNARACR